MLRILAISVSAPVGQFSTNCKSSGDAIPIARTCEKIKQNCWPAARVNETERTRNNTGLEINRTSFVEQGTVMYQPLLKETQGLFQPKPLP